MSKHEPPYSDYISLPGVDVDGYWTKINNTAYRPKLGD